MFILWEALNGRQPAMEMCAKGVEQNYRRQVEVESHMGAAAAFQEYRRPLEEVTYFRYLGRVLTASCDE